MKRVVMTAVFVVGFALGREMSLAPSDPDRLNAFVKAYNAYATSLRQGVLDTKQWEAVRKAWENLR
jgi:hypothetical protein